MLKYVVIYYSILWHIDELSSKLLKGDYIGDDIGLGFKVQTP